MSSENVIKNYISGFPSEVEQKLSELYSIIKAELPHDVEETIGYGIPTFKKNGNIVHFGGFKDHVSFFPGGEAVEVFADELKKYKTSKGTIQFSLTDELPASIIKKITRWRVEQNLLKKNK